MDTIEFLVPENFLKSLIDSENEFTACLTSLPEAAESSQLPRPNLLIEKMADVLKIYLKGSFLLHQNK